MLNSFNAIGRLGRDAELGETRNGDPMARFSIAVDRNVKDGEPDWLPCAFFGDRVRLLAPYLTKGVQVGVSGRLESYKSGDGHSRLVVTVSHIDLLARPARVLEEAVSSGGEPAGN